LVTIRQKQILTAQGSRAQNGDLAALTVGTTKANISKTNSLIWKTFVSDLDAVLDFYGVFEKKAKKEPELYSKLRRLARLVNKEAG